MVLRTVLTNLLKLSAALKSKSKNSMNPQLKTQFQYLPQLQRKLIFHHLRTTSNALKYEVCRLKSAQRNEPSSDDDHAMNEFLNSKTMYAAWNMESNTLRKAQLPRISPATVDKHAVKAPTNTNSDVGSLKNSVDEINEAIYSLMHEVK